MNQDGYLEPSGPARVEERIQRSLFIGHLEPCHDEAEVRGFLGRVQGEHRDATHNCWAYLLGPEPLLDYSSDAGEPSGTAGRPILAALRHSGMVNVMVVVTRYFGGVKLGVRGLIDAYGGVAAKVLDAVPPVERLLTRPFAVSLPYPATGVVTRLLEEVGVEGLAWTYGEAAEVRARVPRSRSAGLSHSLEELRARGTVLAWSSE